MKRPLVLGLAAIAALFLGAILVLDRLTDAPASPPVRPPRAAEPAPAEPPPPGQALPPAPPPPVAVAPEAAPPSSAPPPVQPPPAAAAHAVDLLTSLQFVRARVLECAGVTPPEESEQGRRAGLAARRRGPPRARAVVALDLEPQEGQMLVREARLESREGPNEDLGRCAVELLQGQVLEATKSRPGPNVRMQFVVEEPGR